MSGVSSSAGFEWAQASRPMPGQYYSGDRAVACRIADGVLFAAVDGLGHGPEASQVADLAIGVIEAHANEPPEEIIRACHERLLGTRGVVIAVAAMRVTSGVVEWIAVGDVDLVLAHPGHGVGRGRDRVTPRPGVVGYQLPRLHSATLPLSARDMLIVTTDGIDTTYAERIDLRAPLHEIADEIVRDWSKPTDDALALVASLTEVSTT